MALEESAALLRSDLGPDLDENLEAFRRILDCPKNQDFVFHRFSLPEFEACLIYLEGMADGRLVGELALKASLDPARSPHPFPPEERAAYLAERVLAVSQQELESRRAALVADLLGGMTLVLAEGCPTAAVLETRGYEKRPVGRTQNESVVVGSQEGFVESLRTNVTLVRRYLQSENLVSEYMEIGSDVRTRLAVLHMRGTADPAHLAELKRRLLAAKAPSFLGIGQVEQLIEDHPLALLPQMMQTERPDRAVSCLLEGKIAVFAEGSPYALIAPVTLFHLLHAADDSFLRWQYGTFLRLVRALGLVFSLYLPAFYIALTVFHPHLIPMALLTSIAETRAGVPFSVAVEVLLMEASFFLINEAGTRMPSQIGTALGIVGALILGQAAVAASVISPILIIVIALTGLGNYAVPNYPLSLGVILYRLAMEAGAAVWGFYGILLVSFLLLCRLSGMRSLGQPFCALPSPSFFRNPEILLRLPLFLRPQERGGA